MPFVKADPEQAYIKMSMYGGPGSGKTYTAMLFAEGLADACDKRIAYIDTERGTDFYAKERSADPVHPKAWDFDAIYTRSLSETLKEVRGFDTKTYGVLAIDSISHIWQSAIDGYTGRTVGDGQIPIQAWGKIKRPYKELIDRLQALDAHVLILGRQKNIWNTEGGEWKKDGVAMRAEGDTQYEPHICCHMTLILENEQSVPILWAEKDRSSMIAGKTIRWPTFETIRPILDLLGSKQAGMEDTDARVEADGELIVDGDEKRKAKEEKSGQLQYELQVEVAEASDIKELGAVGAKIKKKKRSLMEDDLNELRVFYEEKRKRLVEQTAGDV